MWFTKQHSVMLNLSNTQFLTQEEIKTNAPSIFTDCGGNTTSEKYCHIPTNRIIEDMSVLGWNVIDVKEVKARKNVGFQKHLVVFRNNDIVIDNNDGDVVYPQILLTNSHDGKNSFTFTAGLFRMICENGLVMSTQEFENMKIRHYGYDFETLQSVIKDMIEKLPLTIESMKKFKETKLTMEKKIEFATKALSVRFLESELSNVHIDVNGLLTPTRDQDNGDDLWTIYNIIQEKLIHGMFNYSYRGKSRKARKIKNFQQDMMMNEKLHGIALEYVN